MYKPKKTLVDIIFETFLYLFMCILVIVFVYPMWEVMVKSVSSPQFARSLGLKLFPDKFNLASYRKIFEDDLIIIGFKNTLIRVIGGTFLTVLVTYFAGYAISKKSLPFRKGILLFIMFTMFFNGGLIPTYIQMRNLGLLESRWALILPSVASAWNIIIARNFIMTIPSSLEECAHIDGANPMQVLFKIMMPLSMPIIAVLSLWSAVYHWNAWFDALIYVRGRDKMVLQLILRRILIDESEELMKEGVLVLMQDDTSPESVKSAIIMVSTIPIIMFYPFLQKYFVKGIMIGSIKG